MNISNAISYAIFTLTVVALANNAFFDRVIYAKKFYIQDKFFS